MKSRIATVEPANLNISGVILVDVFRTLGCVMGIRIVRKTKTNPLLAIIRIITLASPVTSNARTTSVFLVDGVVIMRAIVVTDQMKKVR